MTLPVPQTQSEPVDSSPRGSVGAQGWPRALGMTWAHPLRLPSGRNGISAIFQVWKLRSEKLA